MDSSFEFLRPIISGLIGGACVFLIILMTKSKAQTNGEKKTLEYSVLFKVISLILAPFSLFVLYAALNSSEDQRMLALSIAACFIAGGLFFCYQAFFVKLAYDEQFIYYDSPLCRDKKVVWEQLKDVGYCSILQSDYIVVTGIGRIWCSNMLNGYEELGQFLEKKTKELFPEES